MKIYQKIQNSKNAEFNLVVSCGSKDEKSGQIGISHLLEHMNLAFAKQTSHWINVSGYTTYEYTQYSIKCKNSLNDVKRVIEKLKNIIEGKELLESNLSGAQNDVIKEILEQRENSFFSMRNLLLPQILPNSLREKMPVGNIFDIKKISYTDIVKYQEDNYSFENTAVFSKCKYDVEELFFENDKSKYKNQLKSTSALIPDVKLSIWWDVAQLYYEENLKKNIIYFSLKNSFANLHEFISQEVQKNYFFLKFDFYLTKLVGNDVGATLYENQIVKGVSIYSYEFVCVNKEFDIDEITLLVETALEEIYSLEFDLDMLTLEKSKEIVFEKYQSMNFEDKGKMDFLYGINAELITRKFLSQIPFSFSIKSIVEMIMKNEGM